MDEDMKRAFRRQAWDIYAASLLSMANHPGTTRDGAKPKSLEQIAQEADALLMLRDLREQAGFL
jgi:hypothetical protein